MFVDPGELNKFIAIYRKDYPPRDAGGYSKPTLVLLRSCWAKMTETSSKEQALDNADYAVTSTRFLVRARPGVDRKMLVRYAGNDYEIDSVVTRGDHGEYQELWTKRSTTEVV